MAINRRKHVLDGYKALDFTQFVAGPTVTKLMAEMGAEVIKVELAPDGDRSRAMPFVKNERSGYFVQQNRGKLSLCLDPRSEDSKTIIRHDDGDKTVIKKKDDMTGEKKIIIHRTD